MSSDFVKYLSIGIASAFSRDPFISVTQGKVIILANTDQAYLCRKLGRNVGLKLTFD